MSHHHLVVGAGATGSATANLLASTDAEVVLVTRSGSGPDHPAIRLVAADASDPQQLGALAKGAQAIYNCANPQYHQWTTDWPPLAASLLAAAESSEAVLVTLSNLYGYAAPSRPMHASDPLDPPSIKGGVRAQMWADALDAHRAGRIRATEARASDFIGPGLGATSHMGDRVLPRVLKGKSVQVIGDVDAAHSWTAIADVARTLTTIGAEERAWGKAWHVPTAPPLSQRELVHRMCELAGVDPVRVSSIPKLAIAMGGLFVPAMREMKEVAYQFDAPFVIDSSDTTAAFGLEATPVDETLLAALASYGFDRGPDLHLQR